MTLMKDKPRDDLDELEFTQGQDLDEDKEFSFFELEFGSEPYHEPDPDFSKLSDTLPNFEQDLERFKLKDRYTYAWTQGDLVSYLALEAKYHEINGFIKGLNVLKDVLQYWEEYAWGKINIGDYYHHGDILDPPTPPGRSEDVRRPHR